MIDNYVFIEDASDQTIDMIVRATLRFVDSYYNSEKSVFVAIGSTHAFEPIAVGGYEYSTYIISYISST